MSTTAEIIARAMRGDTDITPEEAAQVTAHMRYVVAPAVNKAAQAIADGMRPAMQSMVNALNSPEGKELIRLAQKYQEQAR